MDNKQRQATKEYLAVLSAILLLAFVIFILSLVGCSAPEPALDRIAPLGPCEKLSTLPAGQQVQLTITTAACVSNAVASVEYGDKLYRVKHTCQSTPITINITPGSYNIGLLLCGAGSSNEIYTIDINGVKYSAKIGYLIKLTF